MRFWWYMLVCNMLIPAVMIVAGRLMWKRGPKTVNGFIGYRTNRSMKNMDTWKFAHVYCGRLWWKVGWFLIVPTILAHVAFYKSSSSDVSILSLAIVSVQVVALLLTIPPTERALKEKFDENGNAREAI